MKKQIFLVLSIFLIAIFLTACGKAEISSDMMQSTQNIAYNVAFTENYVFPEGYEVTYDSGSNTRFTIEIVGRHKALTYRIEGNNVVLDSITTYYADEIMVIVFLTALVVAIAMLYILMNAEKTKT